LDRGGQPGALPVYGTGTMDYEDFGDQRVKHLDMIQSVVSRLGTDSFLVKGWAATLAGAFIGFGINKGKWGLALAGGGPAVVFWLLDAYFLQAERLFRKLFEAVRTGDHDLEPFFMSATADRFKKKLGDGAPSWLRTAFSPTLLLFYGALLGSAVGVAAILRY
jgi:hypothetical protein